MCTRARAREHVYREFQFKRRAIQCICCTMASEELTFFKDSSEDSSQEDVSIQPVKKRRRVTRKWREVQTYPSALEAEKAVEQMKIWKRTSSKSTTTGKRVEYRCAEGKYRVSECPAGIYLLYHSSNTSVSLYETENEHANHTTHNRGLSSDLKLFIEQKFADGISKPNAILSLLRQHQMEEPAKAKLVAFLKTLRLSKGTPSVSATEIRTWCNERIQIPQDEDEPYVLDFNIHAESYEVEEQDLKIVVSTRRLLSIAKKSDKLVQTDATYKLVWQGYPFLLVGTSDANYVFHPFAVAITKGEAQEDFEFLFRALSIAIQEWKPTVLLADGSEAITNAFTSVFGAPEVRLMCFFHVIKNVDKYLRLIEASLRVQLKEDIYTLQSSQNPEIFVKASGLFLKKWKKNPDQKVCDFIEYFEREWIVLLPNWYEGAAVGLPSSNNGVEATNAVIKNEFTLRERLPVGQFLNDCTTKMVKRWSQRRDPKSVNCVHFDETRSISLQLWTKAFQWAAQKPTVIQRTARNCVQYFTCSSKSQMPITQKILKDHEGQEGKWKTFQKYSDWRTKLWKIEVYSDHVTCSCPYFTKKNQCKHSVGMLIKRKEVEVPEEAKNIPLGQKRKRGRPSKAKKALLV